MAIDEGEFYRGVREAPHLAKDWIVLVLLLLAVVFWRIMSY